MPDEQKHKFVSEAAKLIAQGWKIYSTAGTHNYLKERGVKTSKVFKISDKQGPSASSLIDDGKLGLIICVPSRTDDSNDARTMRRLAIDNHIPLLTNAETGRLLLHCLAEPNILANAPKAWQDYTTA